MYWLEMDPIAVRTHEIGARPHYFKNKPQSELDFEQQMRICFKLLSHVMIPDARACFLVGRSIIRGRVIDNVALLQRAAEPHGFATEAVIERLIPSTRKTFNPSHGKINREHLVVFSKSIGS
jgi:site-specific DNA-methyltransferase (cytosine-N4-specific)